MEDYTIFSNIRVSRELTNDETYDFKNFFDLYTDFYEPFIIFEDCKGEYFELNENTKYDGTEILNSIFLPSENPWFLDYDDEFYEMDEGFKLHCNFDSENPAPISSLHYLYMNFFQPKNIELRGYVVAINHRTNKVFYYVFDNEKSVKHINHSEDYTTFWEQCLTKNFDVYHFNKISECYGQYTQQNITEFEPITLFEENYHMF